jgi:sirohydrochlorin ferrochelatase
MTTHSGYTQIIAMALPPHPSHRWGLAAVAVAAAAAGVAAYLAWRARHGPSRVVTSSHLGAKKTVCVLIDNGSLRAPSVVSLRRLAEGVEQRLGGRVPVVPASARMSDRIPAAELGGRPAEILETAVRRLVVNEGVGHVLVLPAFLGPSETLSDFVPEVFAKLAREGVRATFAVGRPVVDLDASGGGGGGGDDRVARAVVDAVRSTIKGAGFASPPAVAICDHGSPTRAVGAVRDHVAAQVRALLLQQPSAGAAGEGDVASSSLEVRAVAACSMERRPGPEYDFTEPLLERLLRQREGFTSGDVVVALLFISPGKHAGDGGDVATILKDAEAEAEAKGARLKCVMTPLLGAHPSFVDVLADRLREMVKEER